MSVFDIEKSVERAERRLGTSRRRTRSDRGRSRLGPEVEACLREVLGGQDKPPGREMLLELEQACKRNGLRMPSRATVYKQMRTLVCSTYQKSALPPPVRHALYNVAEDADVPGHLVVFYCFNYGDSAAMSFAAGLPWLALYQAARMRGFRARSRGLLGATIRTRGIRDG